MYKLIWSNIAKNLGKCLGIPGDCWVTCKRKFKESNQLGTAEEFLWIRKLIKTSKEILKI